jgi:predicted flap endonuclease-1-like 5' DNA nuclease
MFELNPLAKPDAWWQHILMLLVASLIGYIIGYISRKRDIEDLEADLTTLEDNLTTCLNAQNTTSSIANAMVAPTVISHDDLKVVEGIGPKIEELLNQAGIYTFHQLANTTPTHLTEILRAAGSRFQIHDPSTWAAQALLAAEGKMDELKKWQNELSRGKMN